jgi:hypothetical protein
MHEELHFCEHGNYMMQYHWPMTMNINDSNWPFGRGSDAMLDQVKSSEGFAESLDKTLLVWNVAICANF